MPSAPAEILKFETLLIAIGIYVIVQVTRKVTELIWPAVSPGTPRTTAQNYWEKLVLPLAPVLVGIVLVWAAPASVYPTWSAHWLWRTLLGTMLGTFDSTLVRVLKAVIERDFKVEVKEDLL
jgi:hypothetical protein